MKEDSQKRSLAWIGLLTFSAGLVNGEAVWGAGLAVSHHTGNLTQLAAALRQADFSLFLILAGLILSFFIGSMLAGVLFYRHEIGKSSSYGLFSLIQGTVTLTLPLLLPSGLRMGFYFLAALALGMQNSILLKYKGSLTRTSHMTGYLTDAGVALGERLRGEKTDFWKFGYFAVHLLLFAAGALLGVLASDVLPLYALPLTGAVQLLSGLLYLLLVKRKD